MKSATLWFPATPGFRLAPRGASGLKSAGYCRGKRCCSLAPRGASGLKSITFPDKVVDLCLAPRGASGLKSHIPEQADRIMQVWLREELVD